MRPGGLDSPRLGTKKAYACVERLGSNDFNISPTAWSWIASHFTLRAIRFI